MMQMTPIVSIDKVHRTHRSHEEVLMNDVCAHVCVTVQYLFHAQKACFQWNSLLGKPVVASVEGHTHKFTLSMDHYTKVNVYFRFKLFIHIQKNRLYTV